MATHEEIFSGNDAAETGLAGNLPLHTFKRSFQHARVELNVTGVNTTTAVTACVCWESGWITGPEQPCQAICGADQIQTEA